MKALTKIGNRVLWPAAGLDAGLILVGFYCLSYPIQSGLFAGLARAISQALAAATLIPGGILLLALVLLRKAPPLLSRAAGGVCWIAAVLLGVRLAGLMMEYGLDLDPSIFGLIAYMALCFAVNGLSLLAAGPAAAPLK